MVAEAKTRPTGLKEARTIVKDLFAPRAAVYWPDLLCSAAIGWFAFVAAIRATPESAAFGWWLVLAVLSLYRAVLFIHELTHLSKGALPGFEWAWNLIVGVPMLVPSFMYIGVHTDHHRRTLYGTPGDPEYLPLGCGPRWRILLFLAETVIVPFLFVIRFVVVAPIGLLWPAAHRLIARHASSLVINPRYERREGTPAERQRMRWMETASLLLWSTAGVLAWQGVIPWHSFGAWYLVSFGVLFVNQVRTLAAHRYRNARDEMDVVGQVLDSVTVPGAWWTELWAPVGLRYHALHHYLPDLPYHRLGAAHRRLMRELPEDAPYRGAVSRSLPHVLSELWRDAGNEERLRDAGSGG